MTYEEEAANARRLAEQLDLGCMVVDTIMVVLDGGKRGWREGEPWASHSSGSSRPATEEERELWAALVGLMRLR